MGRSLLVIALGLAGLLCAAGIGVAAYVVGLAWMIRIYRTDPEVGESPWRYREF